MSNSKEVSYNYIISLNKLTNLQKKHVEKNLDDFTNYLYNKVPKIKVILLSGKIIYDGFFNIDFIKMVHLGKRYTDIQHNFEHDIDGLLFIVNTKHCSNFDQVCQVINWKDTEYILTHISKK
jgi:hypothetical protein